MYGVKSRCVNLCSYKNSPIELESGCLYSMKIKKQTRKLARRLLKNRFEVVDRTDEVSSKHGFEVVDETDEVSTHAFGKASLT